MGRSMDAKDTALVAASLPKAPGCVVNVQRFCGKLREQQLNA